MLSTPVKMKFNIKANDFAQVKRYYLREEKMRKIPGSHEANARFKVVLDQGEIKFKDMLYCKKQLAAIEQYKRMLDSLEVYQRQLANIEENMQELAMVIQLSESLVNNERDQKPTGIAYYIEKFKTLFHKKQNSKDKEEYRKNLEDLEEKQKHLLVLQKDKQKFIEVMQPKQEFMGNELNKANLLRLENNKANYIKNINDYNEWKDEVVKELRGCLTQNQLYTLFKYFHNNLPFTDSYAQYAKKMQLNNHDVQSSDKMTLNPFSTSFSELIKEIKFATTKYKEYKATMNNRSISKYSAEELDSFINEIYNIERILISHEILSLEDLKIEEKKIEDNEATIAMNSDAAFIDYAYNSEVGIFGDICSTIWDKT